MILAKLKKISWRPAKPVQVLVFDRTGFEFMDDALAGLNVADVPVRGEDYPVCPKVLVLAVRNFFSGWRRKTYRRFHHSLREWVTVSYLKAMVEAAKPQMVVSFNDNSKSLSTITALLWDEIRFVAIQNGTRWFYHNCQGFRLHFDMYLSFGQFEPDLLRQMGHEVRNPLPSGSWRLGLALKKFSAELYAPPKYDICLVSGYHRCSVPYSWLGNVMVSVRYLAKALGAYLRLHPDLRVCVAKSSALAEEEAFYREALGERVTIVETTRANLLSYWCCFTSEVVVGVHSTMLLECLGVKRKSLFANLGPCTDLHVPFAYPYAVTSEAEFADRLTELLAMSQEGFEAIYEGSEAPEACTQGAKGPKGMLAAVLAEGLATNQLKPLTTGETAPLSSH